MAKDFIEGKAFEGIDFSTRELIGEEFEDCQFENCQFLKVDLSNRIFEDCTFNHCDFSMANIEKTAFRKVTFNYCKLLGLHFEECNPFGLALEFHHCQLALTSFAQLKLTGTVFEICDLQEADFTATVLEEASFVQCNLARAIFDYTNLKKADFRGATHYQIDPATNSVAGAKFSIDGLSGLLAKYDLEIE